MNLVLEQRSRRHFPRTCRKTSFSAILCVARICDVTLTRTHDARAANEDLSHHLPNGKGFVNPWDSFREPANSSFGMLGKILMARWNRKTDPQASTEEGIPKLRPVDFEALAKSSANANGMALTWLGHAAFLLTLPGANILLDPCLSDRCSPVSFAGPKRLVQTPPNVKLDELKLDAVVVSHNHYDHLDLPIMQNLHKNNPDIIFFVPLGNKSLLTDVGITNVVECDWWDSYKISKPKTTATNWFGKSDNSVEITCTPCQHFSSRTAWDRNQTLWSSWHIATPQKSFFFGGDTGYRSVFEGDNEDSVPTCPAFRQVKARFGPCDLAAIPIGAYEPRLLFSPIHCNPKDACDVHVDLGSKKSVGMHWGTFGLGFEGPREPPGVLREELKKRGIKDTDFVIVDIGETVEV
ncbi:Metallo-hydrolase/oxidoreductase [Rhizoclosmatium globosum]|uniref:Metallo-hydrolase/oxidoreductase n=1 Tax=Rhizoclosmatium globosum TaxID=329046 RepID=A0A1Y2B503_9FUNG|nr:Metallo-hydrolase/oxidoreductase [Rhizoclosmatium globosum]|eukprot:ORY29912.1 Metallo-hydrolase/oxidoreductase [Rhizoclosmatium globosum]